MKTLGNIIWFILIGLWEAIFYCLGGLIFCITIIGIPFGKQLFKMASLIITPFGHHATTHFNRHPVANIIWLILFGIEMGIGWAIWGVLFCITIIGIPFGKQCFKMIKLSFIPFGAEVE